MKANPFAILCFIFAFPLFSLGQPAHFRFYQTPQDRGLSSVSVNCLLQDSQGFVWVGTQDGLNRYDGNQFRVFRHQMDSRNSLSGNWINVLANDPKGGIWVGSDGGLDLFDPVKEVFSPVLFMSATDVDVSQLIVTALAHDGDRVLWVGTRHHGLYVLNTRSRVAKAFSHKLNDAISLSHNHVASLVLESSGNLWVGTPSGLNLLEKGKTGFLRFDRDSRFTGTLSHQSILSLYNEGDSKLWVGTIDGLNLIDLKTLTIESHSEKTEWNRLKGTKIQAITKDPRGRFWFGTYNGLFLYDPLDSSWRVFYGHPNDPNSLSYPEISSLMLDRAGQIWIGTGGGLNRFVLEHTPFRHYRHEPNEPNSLSDDTVWSMLRDSRDRLWVGSNKGIDRWDSSHSTPKRFRHEPEKVNGPSDNGVGALLEDQRGRIWIGTDRGLDLYDPVTDTVKPSTFGLPEMVINCLFQDKAKRLWIGSLGHGAWSLDLETGQKEHFLYDPQNPNGISSDEVWCFFEDAMGRFWLGTSGGLNRYDFQTGQFTHHLHDQKDNTSLSHNGVSSICSAENGKLWVGTDRGLNLFDVEQGTFAHFTQSNGLPGSFINSLVRDDQNRIWIATNKGLTRFNPETGAFTSYSLDHGIQGLEFCTGSVFKAQDGELFFGGVNGFNAFYPGDLKLEAQLPQVALTGLSLLHDPLPLKELPLDRPWQNTGPISRKLTLAHREDLVTFFFSALNYSFPKSVRFAHKLEGFDEDWVETGSKNGTATYTKLPAGDYRFRLKAMNKDGVWSEPEELLRLNVQPPPWFSWWAILSYVFTTLMLAFLIHWLIKKKLSNQQSVNKRLLRLNRVKDEFLTNTTYELRKPLTGLINLLESAVNGSRDEPLSDKARKNLNLALMNGKRLGHIVNDLSDYSNLRNRELVLHPRNLDLKTLTDVVMVNSFHLVGGKDLTLKNTINPDLPLVRADERRLEKIIYNLVVTAIDLSKSGTISVNGAEWEGAIRIEVKYPSISSERDRFLSLPGMTLDPSNTGANLEGAPELGVAVAKELVALHGGEFRSEYIPGVGSRFYFTLPDVVPREQGSAERKENKKLQQKEPAVISHTAMLTSVSENKNYEKTILVVDDDPVNCQILESYLSSEPYRIVKLTDGFQGLALVQRDTEIDLVILDVMMPGMSGYEICQKIRLTYPVQQLPVILMTTSMDEVDIGRFMASSVNDFLAKPISKNELVARVKTHLELSETLKSLEKKVALRTAHLDRALSKAERSKREAKKANRAKSDFLSTISHEIRTPLNGVLGMTQLLKDTVLTEEQKELSQMIQQSGNTLLALINDILDFSKIEAGKVDIENKPFDLRTCVENVMDLFASQASESHLDFYYQFQETVPEVVVGDETRLRQILVNLVGNAVKFTAEGRVCLLVKQIQPPLDRAKATASLPVQELQFQILDTGIGISKQQEARLFKPFSQLDNSSTRKYGGTGLGLVISKRLVEKMGGFLRFESREGVGSIFQFSLPMPPGSFSPKPFLQKAVPNLTGKVIALFGVSEGNRVLCATWARRWGMVFKDDLKGLTPLQVIEDGLADLVLVHYLHPWLVSQEKMTLGQLPKYPPLWLLTHWTGQDKKTAEIFSDVLHIPLKPAQFFEKLNTFFGGAMSQLEKPASMPSHFDQAMAQKYPRSILLVEDNVINQKLAYRMLEKMGYRPDLANDGLEAVQALERKPYDLVLMDVHMPKMDGIEATKKIRGLAHVHPQPTIVAVSASALQMDIEGIGPRGLDGYINKPMTAQDLVKFIQKPVSL